MNVALSPEQVKDMYRQIIHENIDVVFYDEIIKTNNLDQLFRNRNAFIIFYPAAQVDNVTMGHYCCLIKDQKAKTIMFFDPLAYKPDEYKKFSFQRNKLYKEQQNTLVSHLLKHHKKGWTIDFNHYQYQSRHPDVATCGRWCVIRCVFQASNGKEFRKTILHLSKSFNLDTKRKLKDNLIVALTR